MKEREDVNPRLQNRNKISLLYNTFLLKIKKDGFKKYRYSKHRSHLKPSSENGAVFVYFFWLNHMIEYRELYP